MASTITPARLRDELLRTVRERVEVQMAGPLANSVALLVADGMAVSEIRAELIARAMAKLSAQLDAEGVPA